MLRSKGAFKPEDIAKALRGSPGRPDPPTPPPEKPRPRVTVNVDIGQLAGAARYAWCCWSDYKQGLAKQEQQIMQLAEERFGWLTVSDIVTALGFSVKATNRCLGRLVEAELAEACLCKDGSLVYIFPRFLPHFALCTYCQTEQLLGYCPKCSCCGAPLPEPPQPDGHERTR
jgi:hypothetical protein